MIKDVGCHDAKEFELDSEGGGSHWRVLSKETDEIESLV